MGRPAIVDLAGLFRSHAGGSAIRRRWQDGVGRLAPLHARVKTLGFPPELPEAAAIRGLVDSVAKVRGSCAFIGQPGALGALRAWVDAAGHGEGCRWIGSPPRTLDERRVFAFLGPAWVEQAVEAAIEGGARVVVCGVAAPGEQVDPPPRGWFLPDPLAGDGRAGILSAGVLAAAGIAGVDIGEGLAGAAETLRVVNGPSGSDNPAWSLARAIRLAETELGRDSVVHVAANDASLSLAAWAARTQAASAVAGGGARVEARALPVVVQAGDEEWIEALASGARNRLLITWELGNDNVTDSWTNYVLSAGQAAARVRVGALDAYSLGSAAALWLRVVACLALLEERDPTALGAANAWHASARAPA